MHRKGVQGLHGGTIHFFNESINNRRSQAVRLIRSQDPKQRKEALESYPELQELIPIITLTRSQFGSLKDILELKEKYGMDYLLELQYILSILQQEDSLDERQTRRGR